MKRRDDFLVGPRERAARAIRAGKTEEALRALQDACEEFHGLHDNYCNHLSLTQALLAEIKGDEWFASFTRDHVFEGYRPRFAKWREMTPEQRVEAICAMHRAHFSEFHVEEDEEKFVVKITACNAGGRLLRDGIARRQQGLVGKPHPWSFDSADFPYYCVHAHFFNELWDDMGLKVHIEWGRQYDEQGNKRDEPCRYTVLKKG